MTRSEINRKYYLKNRDRLAEKWKNDPKRKEYWKQYYLENREILIERARKWNQEHKGAKRLIDERAKLKNNELRWLTVK